MVSPNKIDVFKDKKLNGVLFILVFSLLMVLIIGCGGGGDDSTPGSTVTLSGHISVPPGVVIDSDVNDVNETAIENDSIGSAQSLTNPISVGGYVNRANTGATGRSYALGDRDDYFQVQLKAGDTVTLSIGESDTVNNDLDLYLCNTSSGCDEAADWDDSRGTDKYETLTAASDGTYIVNVYAYDGASNYILTIGAPSGTSAAIHVDRLSTRYDFVPGQAIVRFKETIAAMGEAQTAMERAAAMGLTLAAGAEDREMLMTFDDADTRAEVYQALGVNKKLSWAKAGDDPAMERKTNTLNVIKALRQRGDVLSAEPNYILHHYATEPTDPHYGLQWHYRQINLPQAWDYTTGSDDVIVAVIDTGVVMDHPDLVGQLTDTGYDFISDVNISNDLNGIDNDPDDPGDATTGTSSFHGTHCAGTVAARTNNGIGLAGVSWNTKIMPVRVLGVGGGTLYDIVQGIRYAAGLSNDSQTTPAQPADIISMSLGGGGYSPTTQSLINTVRGEGVIIIAAAGNENTSTLAYPASYDGVISVSAVNINGTKASYSNYGSEVDVAAPGGDSGDVDGDGYADRVWSTCATDATGSIVPNYAAYNGTSMATPHVAGVVALMKALDPALTPAELDTLLSSGAITNDIGATGRDDYYGHGLIDALKAVAVADAGGGGSVPTVLSVEPTTVNFSTSGTSTTVAVSSIGPGTVTGTTYNSNATWLSVSAPGGNGLGSYTLQADRTNLADGTHRATVTFTATLDDFSTIQVSLPVTVQVSSTSVVYNAGYHYVLLVRVNSDNTYTFYKQDNVTASGGAYTYEFTDVPEGGRYLIVAGSDRDNDDYIDNAAECVGAYPSLDQISEIVPTGNRSNLDFPTDLKISITAGSSSADTDEPLPRFMRLH